MVHFFLTLDMSKVIGATGRRVVGPMGVGSLVVDPLFGSVSTLPINLGDPGGVK